MASDLYQLSGNSDIEDFANVFRGQSSGILKAVKVFYFSNEAKGFYTLTASTHGNKLIINNISTYDCVKASILDDVYTALQSGRLLL